MLRESQGSSWTAEFSLAVMKDLGMANGLRLGQEFDTEEFLFGKMLTILSLETCVKDFLREE